MSGGSIYQVDIQVRIFDQYMTNVYHVRATGINDALFAGMAIADIQKSLITPSDAITLVRASTPQPFDKQFLTRPVNIPGTRIVNAQALPLFCRFRVDFSQGPRRPCRKFLNLPTEQDSDGHSFNQAALDYVQQNYVLPLIDNPNIQLCGPTGYVFEGGALAPAIGMRQLRRGSKRKKPVITP